MTQLACWHRPVILLLAGLVACSGAHGQSYVHQYRFDPSESVLSITGGFAGFNLDYALRGTFGLTIDQRPGQPTTYGFTNVRARLVGEAPFHNVALNSLLRMSTWQGTPSNPFTIDFSGWDNQHAPIQVAGTIGNVVLLLDGANRPPCCDFLNYHLTATSHIVSLNPHAEQTDIPAEYCAEWSLCSLRTRLS